MQGMQQHMNTQQSTGATIQMRLPNSQIKNPHLDGFVVINIQKPMSQTIIRAMVTNPKPKQEQNLHFDKALHSHAPVATSAINAWPSIMRPVSFTANESMGRSQGYSPVFVPVPIHTAMAGMSSHATENMPMKASVMGSHCPRQNRCTGLYMQSRLAAPRNACRAKSPSDVARRSMWRYQAAIAMRICFADTRWGEPPNANANCCTYSASSLVTGCSPLSTSNASRIVSTVGIAQSLKLASTGPMDRGMLM
mmetsp:Transcript_133856/g.387486  ORF Transcript_133856/g.387486 Transcript_133856/m.387486 type:complete len:251 (+) Transcript_133856:150-902(+)